MHVQHKPTEVTHHVQLPLITLTTLTDAIVVITEQMHLLLLVMSRVTQVHVFHKGAYEWEVGVEVSREGSCCHGETGKETGVET